MSSFLVFPVFNWGNFVKKMLSKVGNSEKYKKDGGRRKGKRRKIEGKKRLLKCSFLEKELLQSKTILFL